MPGYCLCIYRNRTCRYRLLRILRWKRNARTEKVHRATSEANAEKQITIDFRNGAPDLFGCVRRDSRLRDGIYPAWNDLVVKHVSKVIEALGVLFAWAWEMIVYPY